MASPKNSSQKLSLGRPITYEIKVQGHLDKYWSEWFDGLILTYDEHDDTIDSGPVADLSALHGLLKKVRDLTLPLISVNPDETYSSTARYGHSSSHLLCARLVIQLAEPI
jgi:hypothetical protein